MKWTLAELEALPTVAQAQADDLKVSTSTERVWLSRCTTDDGEPFDHAVTVERLHQGRWVTVERYPANGGRLPELDEARRAAAVRVIERRAKGAPDPAADDRAIEHALRLLRGEVAIGPVR